MSIKLNDTEITDVIYNGIDCDKVIYNGTTVFLKSFDIYKQAIESLELPCLVWNNIPSAGSSTYNYSGLTIHNIYYKNNKYIIFYDYSYSEGLIDRQYWHIGISEDLKNWSFKYIFQNTSSAGGDDIQSSTLMYLEGIYVLVCLGFGYYRSSEKEQNQLTIIYSNNLITWTRITPDDSDTSDPMWLGPANYYSASFLGGVETSDSFVILYEIRNSDRGIVIPKDTISDKTTYYKFTWYSSGQSSYSQITYDFIYEPNSNYLTSGYFISGSRRDYRGNLGAIYSKTDMTIKNNTARYNGAEVYKGHLYDGNFHYRIKETTIQQTSTILAPYDSNNIIEVFTEVPSNFSVMNIRYSKGYMMFIGNTGFIYRKISGGEWKLVSYDDIYTTFNQNFLANINRVGEKNYGENQKCKINYLIIEE